MQAGKVLYKIENVMEAASSTLAIASLNADEAVPFAANIHGRRPRQHASSYFSPTTFV